MVNDNAYTASKIANESVLNHSLQDRDKDNSFRSELADISVKLKYISVLVEP